MTEYQTEVFLFIKAQGGCATKKELVARFGRRHYCNASKHVGDCLGRMVRRGFLKREKRGVYRTRSENPIVSIPGNQLDLFA